MKKGLIFTLAFVLFLIAVIIYFFSKVIVIIAISLLISLIFHPIVSFIETKKIKRFPATLFVFFGFSLLFYFGLSFFIPEFINQINSLGKIIKDISVKEQIALFEDKIIKLLPFLSKELIVNKIESYSTSMIDGILNQISSLLSNIFAMAALIVVIPFTTFFFLKDRIKILKGLMSLIPNKYSEMSYWIFKMISLQLGKYVRGWVIDACFVGVACGIGFYFIGIQNSLALGIIAGIGHLVPYFGPIIGGIPALIISLVQFGNFSALPLISILLITIYTVDNGIIQPYVFSKSVNMHPLLIILIIVAGSELFGIIGMLLAIPTATVIKTAASEFYFAFKNYKISRV